MKKKLILVMLASALVIAAAGCSKEDVTAALSQNEESQEEAQEEEKTSEEEKQEEKTEEEKTELPLEEATLNNSEKDSTPTNNYTAGNISVAQETIQQSAATLNLTEAELQGVCRCIGSYVASQYMESRNVDYVKLDAPVLLSSFRELTEYYVNSQRYVDQDLNCDEDTKVLARAVLDALLDYYGNDAGMLQYLVLDNQDAFESILRNLEVSAK